MKNEGMVGLVGWSLAIWMALATQTSCAVGEEVGQEKFSTPPEATRGEFVVRLISVEPELDEAFFAEIRECFLPVWNELEETGIVSGVSLFELIQMESTYPVFPPWRFLLVAELGLGVAANDLLSAENASSCPTKSDRPPYKVLREQLMACTANSCFRMPEPTFPDAPSGIDYLIEFINVENNPASLAKYQDLMSQYFGPANGLLVERGMLHCFVALEAAETEFGGLEVLTWNQVHVSDHWDEGGDVDWDTVYKDLFRHEFSREVDDVWAEIPPIREISTEYRARLVPDLCVR